MRRDVRLAVWLAFCVVVVFAWSASAVASRSLPGGRPARGSVPSGRATSLKGASRMGRLGLSAFAGGLVVPGVVPRAVAGGLFGGALVTPASPVAAEEVIAERSARLAAPEAFDARTASCTAYEHLGMAAAVALSRQAFPALTEPSSGMAQLPPGARLTRYVSRNAAQLLLAGGKHAVLESLEPIAQRTGTGQLAPLNLALTGSGGAYAPVSSGVAVRIAKRIRGGVTVPGIGVSLTPVGPGGSLLDDIEGVRVGASVFYANTQADADTLVRPDASGFELDVVLRSVRSPSRLFFRVGVPPGARLVQGSRSGGVPIIGSRGVVATIRMPDAQDADGTPVPVSMRVHGDLVELAVGLLASAGYQYPIVVDPQVEDRKLVLESGEPSNWTVYPPPPSKFSFKEFGQASGYIEDSVAAVSHSRGETGEAAYQSQGDSSVIAASANLYGTVIGEESQYENIFFIKKGEATEASDSLPGYLNETREEVKATGQSGNYAGYQQIFTASGSDGLRTLISSPVVTVSQPASDAPTVEADASEYSIKGQLNASRNDGSYWVNPNTASAVIGANAKDPGVGIYKATVTSPSEIAGDNPYASGTAVLPGCHGVQCYECWEFGTTCSGRSSGTGLSFSVAPVYEGKPRSWLPNGEDRVTVTVEDAVGLTSSYTGTVKIDETPPHGLTLTGLGNGSEIGEGQYPLKVEATDGSGTTKSSGIQSLAISVDGRQLGKPEGSCSPGPCTAAAEFTLSGSELGAGPHQLTVTATDNAGNVERETESLYVRHSTPVSLGPGMVDPQSGEFSMQASDVALGAPGAGLDVARSYHSEHLANTASPFGPQWSASLGASETLRIAPNGTATLTSANGETSSFAKNEKGELESPHGDAALKLAFRASESAYVLQDPAQGISTKFVQPAGSSSTPPQYAGQFGSSSKEGGSLSLPAAIALDAEKNLWVADQEGHQIDKFAPTGQLLASYQPHPGTRGTLVEGIAVSPANGNIYFSSSESDEIEEMSPSGTVLMTIDAYGTEAGTCETSTMSQWTPAVTSGPLTSETTGSTSFPGRDRS
jgi:hypothetical protein